MAFDVPNNQEFALSPRVEHSVNLVAGHFSNKRWELCTVGMRRGFSQLSFHSTKDEFCFVVI